MFVERSCVERAQAEEVQSFPSVRLPRYPVVPSPKLAEDLCFRVARGDMAALGEVYDEHHRHVRVFARRLLGDESAAEDLVQETFLTLPGALKNFRGDASLQTFIVGVAANHARHHVRAAARRRNAHERSESHDVDRAPPSTPEDRASRQELARRLTRALDALPFEQRIAFVLCEVEERSSAEAGAIAGAPEATIRTRVFHARRKLRELLSLGEEP